MNTERIEYELDLKKLFEALIAKTGKEGLRDIGRKCGISASTLSRMNNGERPDMTTFCQLCAYLDQNPGNFFTRVVWTREK